MMENNEKKYWKGLEELHASPDFVKYKSNEFAEELPIDELLTESKVNTPTPRRDFLKALGFGMGAVALAACNEAPVQKAIPYLIKPEEIVPGIPNYYTSNYNGLGVLVKTREGRPIKIEGNPNDPISNGGTDAQAQAAVLDLYDTSRLKNPVVKGVDSNWDAADKLVKASLAEIATKAGNIRILTNTILSPSTKSVIADFSSKYANVKQVVFDATSYSGIINANKNSFEKAGIPSYKFDKAAVIVSFDADFLGTWISPVEFTKQYVSLRNHKSLENKKMSRHIQIETGLSMTGTNADARISIKPSQHGSAVIALYNEVATLAGIAKVTATELPFAKKLTAIAKELWAAKGNSLVVSGSNDVSVQVVINAINAILGNYGSTIDLDNLSNQYQGNDAEMQDLLTEMNAGKVDALFILGANPAYSFAQASAFKNAMAKVKLKVSLADRANETAVACDVIAPNTHFLESWDDASARAGVYSVVQPTISPVYNARPAAQSLLMWADLPSDYLAYIKAYWEKNIYPSVANTGTFTNFWEVSLQTGSVVINQQVAKPYAFNKDINAVANTIRNANKNTSQVELAIYQNTAIRNGEHANNPWLQEMPDPVSKVTWDNYAAINPIFAKELGLTENSMVTIKSANNTATLPVLMQPGQAMGTVSVAIGYGRTAAGKAGSNVGVNIYPFLTTVNGTFQNYNSTIELVKAEGTYELAQTQTHHTIEGRDIVKEKTLAAYAGHEVAPEGEHHASGEHAESKGEHHADLWAAYQKNGHHHWAMTIDLNACTGCGACVVACNSENNVPVVGRDEVRRRREMHWIRIDRYYTFEDNAGKDISREKEYNQVENYENVKVVHQPMLCQHCDHAPCETVCPVLATMHSSEGLNQMVYNRCIGTRYCGNNCPYKVRRFNWFNYWNDERFANYLHNEAAYLALNPDVTTRFRGVMEKCSFCAQRIQAGKLKAKIEHRPLKDGDVVTACQQGCPANAIVFGDVNDPNSEVAKLIKGDRTYFVLEEINVQPGIGYMTKIRNTVES